MFLLKSKPPLTTRRMRSLRAAAHFNSSALCLCKRFHPFVAAAGKTCLMQRSRRCGHGVVVSKMCYVQYSDCVQDCALSCDMWLLQTNEQLSRGAISLSAACLLNATQGRKEIYATCLRNPCFCWNLSLHSLPEAWGPWDRPHTSTALHCACIMLAKDAIPLLQLQEKPVSCREAEGVVTELWSPRCVTYLVQDLDYSRILIVLSVVTCDCCKPMNTCQDLAFSNSGLASLSAADFGKMWCSAGKRFMRHVCLRNPCFCGSLSLHSLPEAWGPWERQHAQQLCIMLAKDPIPSLQLQKKVLSHAEKQSVWSRSGLEAGLPAFQLPMFAKCEALQKRDMLDMFV